MHSNGHAARHKGIGAKRSGIGPAVVVEAVDEAAARWVVALADGDCDTATLAEFDQWLDGDPARLIAFNELCAVWRTLGTSLRPGGEAHGNAAEI